MTYKRTLPAILAGTLALAIHASGCTGNTAVNGAIASATTKKATTKPTATSTRGPGSDSVSGGISDRGTPGPTASVGPESTPSPAGSGTGTSPGGQGIVPTPTAATGGGNPVPTAAPVLTPTPGGGGTTSPSKPYDPADSSKVEIYVGSSLVGNRVSVIYEPAPDGNNSLNKPTTIKLTASVLLTNGLSDSRAKWEIKNKLVATVDGNGLVTAVGRGRTEVIARPLDDFSYGPTETVPTATAVIEVQAVGAVDLVVE